MRLTFSILTLAGVAAFAAGAVVVTVPADGEHLVPGKVIEVTWVNSTTTPSSVYVSKDGKRVYLVQDYKADRGRVMWRVPNDDGAEYVITAEATNGVKASSKVIIGGTASLPDVYATPNPFDLSAAETVLTIAGAPVGSTAKIFDMEGIEVKALSASPLEWDGRNSRGDAVAGGTYLFVVETPSGEKFNGKIAVVK